MRFFQRRNQKPKPPEWAMAESIVNTVVECHKYHIPLDDITKHVAGYLQQYELSIRGAMQIELMQPLPFLKAHFDAPPPASETEKEKP